MATADTDDPTKALVGHQRRHSAGGNPASPNRTEPDPPSAEEAAALLNDAWADPEWGLLLWLTMITRSRRGEVTALRWRHVDTDRAVLWIHRSNAQTRAGIKEKETKTGQRRKIALTITPTRLSC